MPTIDEIKITKLFGRYNYNINAKNKNILLYGDNGSGKSTILKLAFHMLSTQQSAGHKTWVANCPFKTLTIELSSRVKIIAKRSKELIGNYTMQIISDKKTNSYSFNAIYVGDSYTIPGTREDLEYFQFMAELDKLSPSIVYLTDSRSLLFNSPPYWSARPFIDVFHDSSNITFKDLPIEAFNDNFERIRDSKENKDFDLNIQLSTSLRNVNIYFNRLISEASREGDSNVNQIYLKILRDISSPSKKAQSRGSEISKFFSEIQNRIPQFIQYGIMPSLDLDAYLNIINNTHGTTKAAINKAIIPLLDSLEERMNALEKVKNLISNFINILNEVLLDKQISYQYGQMIQITSSGLAINLTSLSSGEKQLINILCNLVCRASTNPIFFIDEPEISLNIKWQREFMKMLEITTSHAKCQFFLATHSMEILAQNTDSIINLNEQRNA